MECCICNTNFFYFFQTDVITENILNAVDGVLGANSSVVIQSNVKDGSSSTVLRSLDTLAVFITLQPQRTRRSFSRPNVALAIENKTNSFTFIARDQNQSLEVVTREGKLANQIALATLFVPESLLARANDVQVYSYVYRSGLLFLQDFDSQALQSIVMAASVPNRKITDLADPVVIALEKKNNIAANESQISTCQFWVPEQKGFILLFSFYFSGVENYCYRKSNIWLNATEKNS